MNSEGECRMRNSDIFIRYLSCQSMGPTQAKLVFTPLVSAQMIFRSPWNLLIAALLLGFTAGCSLYLHNLIWVGAAHLTPGVPTSTGILLLKLSPLTSSCWQPPTELLCCARSQVQPSLWTGYFPAFRKQPPHELEGWQMLLLLSSRLANPDSETHKDFAQGHSSLVAESRKKPQQRIFYREYYFSIGGHSWLMKAQLNHKSLGLPLPLGIQ